MTDHGHDVSFGYFLIPNADDPLLSTAQEVERLGLDYIGVQDHPTSAASSTPGRCCR